jgi:hypothetical protein
MADQTVEARGLSPDFCVLKLMAQTQGKGPGWQVELITDPDIPIYEDFTQPTEAEWEVVDKRLESDRQVTVLRHL